MIRFRRVVNYLTYHMHLDKPRVVKTLMYMYRDRPIIYIIRNNITNMLYVGSSMLPSLRFHNHLVTGTNSNARLQEAMRVDGKGNFTAYVMEIVKFPNDVITTSDREDYLHMVEQSYMDKFPVSQLYNDKRSSIL